MALRLTIEPSLYPIAFGSVLRDSLLSLKDKRPGLWGPAVLTDEGFHYLGWVFEAWSFAWVEYFLTVARKAPLPVGVRT
jgi:hypothetical protein